MNQFNSSNKNALMIILSVIITAFVIGGGVFLWQRSIIDKIIDASSKEQQSLKQQIESLQKQLSVSDENKQEPGQVNIVSGNGVRVEIVNGIKYCEDKNYPEIGYQKILKAIYPNNSEKILYSTSKTIQSESEGGCLFSEGICCLELSPDGQYLIFLKTGWEWSKPYMLNVDTGKYVFGDESDIFIVREIKWSSDNNNFAIITDVNEMGGVGEMGVYASEYNNPDKIKKIWSAKNYFLSEIKNISFVGNDKLYINIEQSDKENLPKKSLNYEYDFRQDKLSLIN